MDIRAFVRRGFRQAFDKLLPLNAYRSSEPALLQLVNRVLSTSVRRKVTAGFQGPVAGHENAGSADWIGAQTAIESRLCRSGEERK